MSNPAPPGYDWIPPVSNRLQSSIQRFARIDFSAQRRRIPRTWGHWDPLPRNDVTPRAACQAFQCKRAPRARWEPRNPRGSQDTKRTKRILDLVGLNSIESPQPPRHSSSILNPSRTWQHGGISAPVAGRSQPLPPPTHTGHWDTVSERAIKLYLRIRERGSERVRERDIGY